MEGLQGSALVVAISTRSLFDLDGADEVFASEGLTAYRSFQREHEDVELGPGTAIPLVRALLALNENSSEPLVEVILVSRNDPDTGLRIMNSIEAMGLDIRRAAFTAGADPVPFLEPFGCNLFLSREEQVVQQALARGLPAARVLEPPEATKDRYHLEQLHFAFDGDSVLVDGESDRVFAQGGYEAFVEREVRLVDTPMSPGPFHPFLLALGRLQERLGNTQRLRISLVTARDARTGRRFVHTFREWGVNVDETFFMAGGDKSGVLRALRPQIFFDDRHEHVDGARSDTPSAHVPFETGS